MKKKEKLMLGVALLSICLSQEAMADRISLKKAKEIAREYMSENSTPQLARPLRAGATRADGNEEETFAPLYLFSRGADRGFVVVSGNDNLPQVLGYCDHGDYDEANMPPTFIAWLNYFTAGAERATELNAPARAPEQRISPSWTTIAPLVTTAWHQSAPYNNLCPTFTGTENHCVTGCVATSASQIIHFFRADNPDSLLRATTTYSSGTDNPVTRVFAKGTPIKYDLMLNNYNSSYPAEMGEAVATLMASVGAATHLNYMNEGGTSGQISDAANTMRNYFGLSCECIYRGETAQSTWESMIYNDIKMGRPMVYTGYDEGAGGHAFVLDGYSNGKFHFNFGWGGSADGYYTLDLDGGVNNFDDWQGMVYKVTPQKQNLKARIKRPVELSLRTTGEIEVHVDNNGTLAYSGIYLLASNTKNKPALSSAADKDVETSIARGQGADFTFKYKPTLDKSYTLFITDGNSNILDSLTLRPKDSTPDLYLESLTVNGNGDSESTGGHAYRTVHNERALISAVVSNRSPNSCEGTFKLTIKGYAADGDEESVSSSTKSQSAVFAPGETRTILFTSNTLKEELYYTAQLNNVASAISTRYDITFEGDSVVYLRNSAPTLACTADEAGNVTVSGKWNNEKFDELIAACTQAVTFDLTAVSGIDRLPVAPNPNALYYVAADCKAQGKNIVKEGICANLHLTRGHDFAPLGDFTAQEAAYDPATEPNRYSAIYLPFDCAVPSGGLAKQGVESTKSKLTFELVRELNGGTPYFYTFNSEASRLLTARNVTVSLQREHTGDSAFAGTYSRIVSPQNALLLSDDETQYFVPVDSANIEGLCGYYVIEGAGRIRPTNLSSDARYQQLGQEIDNARTLLAENSALSSGDNYNALLAAIETAEAVYNLQELTSVTQINSQTNALKSAEESFLLNLVGSTDNPVDYTGYLKNPSFESGNITGWKLSGLTGGAARSISSLSYYCSGADGSYLFYSGSNFGEEGGTVSQTMENLPAGDYLIKLKIALKEGETALLSAGDKQKTISGHKFGIFYFSEQELAVTTTEPGLTLSVTGSSLFKLDDVRIYNVGSDIETAIELPTIGHTPAQKGVQLTVSGNTLRLASATDTTVKVYSIGGATAAQVAIKAGGEATVSNLAPGLYVVAGRKVAIR